MKLAKRARYTLRLMVGIGKASQEGRSVSLNEISRYSGISRRYLDHLTVSLKNARLIKSRSGRGGGYVLGKPAGQIRVAEILQAAVGPVEIAECVTAPETCLSSEFCSCRNFWTLLHRKVDGVLNEYSLADLLDQEGLPRNHEELQPKKNITGAIHD